jgi:transcriptional antiterminator/mannitol/fructose-specific phosphotransferase system IIA component (Ntr-type)
MGLGEVALAVGTGERAVRYDVELGALWLRAHELKVVSRAGVGSWVEGPDEAKAAALESLLNLRVRELTLSPSDRRVIILSVLLGAEEPEVRCADGLRQLLGISVRTLYGDLASLEDELAGERLALGRSADGWLSLVGAETDIRDTAFRLLEQFGPEGVCEFCREGPGSEVALQQPGLGSVGQFVAGFLSGVDFGAVSKAVTVGEKTLGVTFAEPDVFSLLLRVAIMVRRIIDGCPIEETELEALQLAALAEGRAAHALAKALQEDIGCDIPVTEIPHLVLGLLTTRVATPAGPTQTEKTTLDYLTESLVTALLSRVSADLGVDLAGDPGLREDLTLHLRPALVRLAFGIPIHNSLQEHIRQDYPAMYRVVESVARELITPVVGPVPAAEVAYLVMHIGAALERVRVRAGRRCRVLVVCPSGISTSRILASRLESEFPQIDVVGVLASAGNVDETNCRNVDLVVSTVEVDCRHPTVKVNPLLPADDLGVLADVLRKTTAVRATPRGAGKQSPGDDQARSSLSLRDLLHDGVVRVRVAVRDCEEAIRAAGRLLLADGSVEATYLEAMVRMFREIGPYIVVAPGVALPHARPEDGVIRMGLSVVTLENPVVFGHDTHDPVDIVFAFAGMDYFSHLRAFTELAGLFRETDRLERLRKADTPAKLIEIITEKTPQ